MTKILCIVSVVLGSFCFSAIGAAQNVVMSQNIEYGVTPSPNNLIVELRTASNQSVSWTLNGLQSLGTLGDTISRSVRADTAASMGVDWTAWSAAVIDPTYNRYVVTWDGVTKEMPWPIPPRITPFEMDRLEVLIGGWAWPQTPFGSKFVEIGLAAIDEAIVPEPGSFMLAIMGMLGVEFRRRRKCS